MAIGVRSATVRLADFVLGLKFEELPPEVVERAKGLFLDFLGVAFGGRLAESAGPVLRGVGRLRAGQPGEATVVGEGEGYPAHYAALVNGTFAHSQDFDDTHREGIIHPGAPIFATLLALAEVGHRPGKEFLTAAVAGYEVSCRLGRAHGERVHARGFHPTATTGVFGATAAGARLLGLEEAGLLNAWGLNLSQAAGSLQFLANGAWNKRVHTGLAAHNAIVALTLAQEGVIGAADPFVGRFGYYFSYAGEVCDLEAAVGDLGRQFEVMRTAVKPYPCCRYNHAVIDACLEIVAGGPLRPEEVEAVEVILPAVALPLVAEPEAVKKAPANVVDAQFSVHFAAAVALTDGRFGWESYRRISEPGLRALMGRVGVAAGPVGEMGARVTVRTRDGRERSAEVKLPRGEPEAFPTWAELVGKMRPLAGEFLPAARVDAIIEMVGRLEAVEDLVALGRLLRPQ